jgi:hypothetical protein
MLERPKNKSDPLGIAVRQLLAIAGAFSLIGLIKDFLTWQHDLGLWIDAFRAFTRPIATFLFGWILALFHLSFPEWLKDYLTVGLISSAAFLCMIFYRYIRYIFANESNIDVISRIFALLLAWPIAILTFAVLYVTDSDENRKTTRIFASVYIYAFLIIALNYAFIAGGAETGG